MKKHFLFITALMSLIVLSSCGDDRATKAKDYLQQKIADESGNAFKLESFTKTNGVEHELMGMKIYTLEWDAQVSVQKEVWKSRMETSINFLTYDTWGDFKVMTKVPKEFVNKAHLIAGTTIRFKGDCEFQKTDNGWLVEGWQITSHEILNKDSAPAK